MDCEACLVLQPFQWDGARALYTPQSGRTHLQVPGDALYHIEVFDPWTAGPVKGTPEPFRNPLEYFLRQQLGPADSRLAGLTSLLLALRRGQLRLVPVYGLNHPSVRGACRPILDKVTRAANEAGARQPQGGPTVLLLVGELPEAVRASPAERGGDLSLVQLEVPGLGARLTRLRPDETLLLVAGRLPRPLFEHLCACAQGPILLEGANTANLALMVGKPYLSLKSTVFSEEPRFTGFPQRFPGAPVADPEWQRLGEICDRLPYRDQADSPESLDLTNYFLELRQPDSPAATYWRDVVRLAHTPGHDVVTQGLWQLRERCGQTA
jgi:hypothetical protein